MRKALSVKAIEAFKPEVKRYEVHDLLCPGFSLRVFPTGRKVFSVKYRYGLTQRRLPLGVHPRISLAEARNKALEALRLVDEGIDPAARRRQLGTNVEAICGDFIRQYARPRNRSWKEAERILQREFVAVHGQRDIRDIKRHDILELMDGAIERGASYQANRIHSNLRKLFNWCMERGIVDVSPVMGTKPPTREQARDRVLTDDEIRALLKVCAKDAYPFRQFVPLLLATAQRRGEVSQMKWSEVDLDAKQWVIPADLSKTASRTLSRSTTSRCGCSRKFRAFPNAIGCSRQRGVRRSVGSARHYDMFMSSLGHPSGDFTTCGAQRRRAWREQGSRRMLSRRC